MIDLLKKNIIRFIFIVLVQSYLLKFIKITNLEIAPFLYILFILLLPYETKGWLLLSLAFFEGFLMDLFLDSYGEHTASLLFVAFFRPTILNFIINKENVMAGTELSITNFGFSWFIKYAAMLVFIHNLCFFMLEEFQFTNFMNIALKTLLTTIFTLIVIVIVQFLNFNDKTVKNN